MHLPPVLLTEPGSFANTKRQGSIRALVWLMLGRTIRKITNKRFVRLKNKTIPGGIRLRRRQWMGRELLFLGWEQGELSK